MNLKTKFKDRVFLKKLFLGVIIAVSAVFLVSFVSLLVLAKDLPTREQIINREVTQSTKIYDRTGQNLLYEISGGQKRTFVPLDQIPKSLKDATISLEDENFYSEGPINFRGIARAVIVNLTHGGVVQGGSTITQQLAKKAFLSDERTWTRKAKELLLAIRLDQEYSKDQILELYLNEIPYGPTAYGVESASQTYFNKPARDLTLAESAILASIPKAPSYYSPWGSHVAELRDRQKRALEKMLADGKITQAQFDEAINTKVVFQPRQEKGILAPHFVMAVQEYLDSVYGDDVVRGGGLKVITTLDLDLQKAAEKAVADGAARNEKLYSGTNAALVAQDPKTGQILAMAGSRNYFDTKIEGNFNVATQGLRQPGSTLKPFVYLTAFEKGFVPQSILFDTPVEFANNSACPLTPPFPAKTPTSKCFHPDNFDDKFLGPVTIKESLSQSRNVPAVKMLYLVGMNDALSTMNRFGLKTLDDPNKYGLALVLGGGAVHLVDLVEAYAGLAQEGVRHDQTMVLEVRGPKGDVLEKFNDKSESIFEPNYVRMINDILSDQNARANLLHGSLGLTVFPGHDVALKTGTSNDYGDAWAVGYTPSFVAGVWAGNNNNVPMKRNGGSVLAAIPMWSQFMKEAMAKDPGETFTKPDITTPDKPILRGEYYVNGQIHNELFWINRSDPTGAYPSNPQSDSQFNNWEMSLNYWLNRNPISVPNPGGDTTSTPPATTPPPPSNQPPSNTPPTVQINSPSSGDLVGKTVPIQASISSANPVVLIRVIWNGRVIQEFSGDFGEQYEFNWSFSPGATTKTQNVLTVEATSGVGVSGSDSVNLFGA